MTPRYSPRFAPAPGAGALVTSTVSVTSLPSAPGVRRYRLRPGASPSVVSVGSQRGGSIVVDVKRRRRSSSMPSSSYSSMQMAQAAQSMYYTGGPFAPGYYSDISESYYDAGQEPLSSLDYEGSYFAEELTGDGIAGKPQGQPAADFTFPYQIHMQPPAQSPEPIPTTIQVVMQPPAEPAPEMFAMSPDRQQRQQQQQMLMEQPQMQAVQEPSKPIIIHHQTQVPPGQPPRPIVIHHQTPNMEVQISSTSDSTTSIEQAPQPTRTFRPQRAYSPPPMPPHYHDMSPPPLRHLQYSPPPPPQEYGMSPPPLRHLQVRRPRRFPSVPSPSMMSASMMPSPAGSTMLQPMMPQPPPPP
ncbi:unnamed protein product [Ixodes hexagonus]